MPSRQRIRTLVVDDSPDAQHSISFLLESHPTAEIVGFAGNGSEALELIERLQPSLVLMDMQMPGMNGLAAIYEMRKRFPDTWIIIVTIYDGDEMHRAYRSSGAHGFVSKNRLPLDLWPEIDRVFSLAE